MKIEIKLTKVFIWKVLKDLVWLRVIMSRDVYQKSQIIDLSKMISKYCSAMSYEIHCRFVLYEVDQSTCDGKRDIFIDELNKKIPELNRLIEQPERNSLEKNSRREKTKQSSASMFSGISCFRWGNKKQHCFKQLILINIVNLITFAFSETEIHLTLTQCRCQVKDSMT